MSELQTYYNEYCMPRAWQRDDPNECGCYGRGWFVSELDTVHQCNLHYHGQPHPEDGGEEDGEMGEFVGPLQEWPERGAPFADDATLRSYPVQSAPSVGRVTQNHPGFQPELPGELHEAPFDLDDIPF